MGALMIAAVSSGVGKTTITCGVLRALSKRGYTIQPYKVGPDYIDPAYHELASGFASKNLDEFILGKEELRNLYAKNASQADISVVEGVMGLFDGYQADSDFSSSASVSKILKLPVILVMDCKAMAASAGAIAQGFARYDKDLRIAGFILNNVGSDNHFHILKKVIEKDTGIPVLGRFPKEASISLSSRHLGLVPQGEVDEAEKKIEQMAALAETYLDIDQMISISETAGKILNHRTVKKSYDNLVLAVAMDKAFNFYYRDALDLLEEIGVQPVYFSPLKDEKLPDCHGIYIGGGYPEVFAEELEANASIRKDIFQASQKGMPIYAECGGLMYLGQSLRISSSEEEKSYEMVGVFEGQSVMTKGLKRFGYCTGKLERDCVIGRAGDEIRGHEFHHSVFETEEETVYEMSKSKYDGNVDCWRGGYLKGNTFASYLHVHFCSNYEIAYRLCDKMEEYRAQNL